ncbi:MAG TPA: hypothetical protein VIF62_27885 [Labilithrix sp.]
MRRGARRVFLLVVALAPPACSTYGRDTTTVVEVHDDAGDAAATSDGDDALSSSDGAPADAHDAEAGRRSTHLVFITEGAFDTFSVGSATHADDACANEALMDALSGTFRAWLSDGVSSPKTRFVEDGPWRRHDGMLVAADLASLESGVLQNPINQDGVGNNVTAAVWTGTVTNGTASGNDCKSWTSTDFADVASIGVPTATDATWTNAGTDACSNKHHLYCFSQPD